MKVRQVVRFYRGTIDGLGGTHGRGLVISRDPMAYESVRSIAEANKLENGNYFVFGLEYKPGPDGTLVCACCHD
jgi:hypothetical protein